MRKVMAILAACSLTVSVCVFVKSFFGLTMDKLAAKAFLLHVGILVLAIPLAAVEGRPKGLDPFRGKPTWDFKVSNCFSVQRRSFLYVPRVKSCCFAENCQWRVRFEQSWKNC